MACSFSQSLLATVVAIVVAGSAVAQDTPTPLNEAVKLLRLGQKDEAMQKLRDILAGDPSNADALNLYQSVTQEEWYLLMTSEGEFQQIAKSLLARAKVENKQRSRDEAAIRTLVDAATKAGNDHGTRQAAITQLIKEHGEFAVPVLVEKLGNADDAEGQIQAIYALTQIGTVAVLPLIEAMKSSNPVAVQNAAAALFYIGDLRAAGVLMHHATKDDRAAINTIAKKAVEAWKLTGSDVELQLAQARQYLKGDVPAGGFSEVVWHLVDDKLVATDVVELVYPAELAKSCAADAVRYDGTSLEARSVLAQGNLSQANLIETSIAQGDESTKPLEAVAAELKIAALASGVDSLRMALDAGVKQGMSSVAVGAIHALASTENVDTVSQSALLAALDSSDKRVKYAAAEALVRASGGVQVPAADKVVGVLAEAVAEESVRTIQVIAPALESRDAVQASSSVRGFALEANADAVSGMRSLLINPNVDVVVINEILPDRLPEDVIGNVRKDKRMEHTRIVVITKDEEAAKARFGDSVTFVAAPLDGAKLTEAVQKALEGATNASGARAEAYASQASEALLSVAANKGAITGALASLGKQLNRADAVAVPAAKALGLGGSLAEMEALVGALGGSGSLDLKKAAATAIGNVLARASECPDSVSDALAAVLASDADVSLRTAAAAALGKAKLDAAKKAELQKKLARVAAGPKSEG
jgi:hypothetical protein